MGLLEGLRTGASVAGQWQQAGRDAEDRERLRKRRSEEDEIQKAGLDAAKEALAEAQASAKAQQPSTIGPNPAAAIESEMGMRPVPPSAPPAAEAIPVAPPGSGAAPSGESLSMTDVSGQSSGLVGPAANEQNFPPPPGSTIPPGTPMPSMAQMRAGGEPAAAGTVQPAAIGMRRQPTRSQLDAQNAVLMAQSRKALELGRSDLALQYHQHGMAIRDRLRGEALDQAEQQYRTTGDVNAFVPVFNRFIANGTSIESIAKSDAGYAIKGKTDDGKAFSQNVTGRQMDQYLEFMRDPRAARAMEAKRADELRKAQIDASAAAEKERVKVVPAGSTVVDTETGGTFTAPEKTASKYDIKVVKNDDGGERLVRVDQTTGRTQVVYGGAESDGIPKAVSSMQKDATGAIFKAYGTDSDAFAGLDEDQKGKVLGDIQVASDLVVANHGTDNWGGMSAAKAAAIARSVGSGKTQVVQMKVPGVEKPVRGVVYEGRKYLLDRISAPKRAEGGQQAFNRSEGPASMRASAPKRESDRRQILESERTTAMRRVDTARSPEDRARAQSDLDSINRELGIRPVAR